MELRQLKYFSRAYELQNFTEAARQLHISQSTLSQQIRQLEDELSVQLFDRVGKKVVPTEAGSAFYPYACRTMTDAENGRQIIRDLKGIRTGELHVGVTYSLGGLLTAALSDFTVSYPGVRVLITFGTSEELTGRLSECSIDLALSFKPEGLHEEFDTMLLFSSELRFIVHSSHPMAGLDAVSLRKISGSPLILPARGFATRKAIEDACIANEIRLSADMEINDVETILRLLRDGRHGTVMSQEAVRDVPELVQIPITSRERLISQAYLFWPAGTYRKKSALALVNCLIRSVSRK